MSIQGHLLEVTVVGCNRLRDTEWVWRQDPYVCFEYASTKFRTRTCTDGGKNPIFQEKFVFNLIEGLREISISVWGSNTLTFDDFIGSAKVQIHKVLSHGYDDTPWTIQSKSDKYAGEVSLVMHYATTQIAGRGYVLTVPPYAPGAPPPATPPYAQPYPATAYAQPAAAVPSGYPAPAPTYPSHPPANPAALYPAANPYPPQTYPPAPAHSAYPPAPYPLAPQAYPPPTYPPAPGPSTYPPPPSY